MKHVWCSCYVRTNDDSSVDTVSLLRAVKLEDCKSIPAGTEIRLSLPRRTDGQNFPKGLLRVLSPRANYTDRAAAAGRRSYYQLLRIEGCHVVRATNSLGR